MRGKKLLELLRLSRGWKGVPQAASCSLLPSGELLNRGGFHPLPCSSRPPTLAWVRAT